MIQSIPSTQQPSASGIDGCQVIEPAPTAPRDTDQRGCRVNRCAVDVSPGIERKGADDGATQKATQAVKKLEAHIAEMHTRWVLYPAIAKNAGAKLGRDKYRMRQTGLPRTAKPSAQAAPAPERDQGPNLSFACIAQV